VKEGIIDASRKNKASYCPVRFSFQRNNPTLTCHLFVRFWGVWVAGVGHQVDELFGVVQGQVQLGPAKLPNRVV